MTEDSPIFIVGMPRSGTTLMQASLAAHPQIAISPQTHFLSYWVPHHPTTEPQNERDFERFWTEFVDSPQFRDLGLDADTLHGRLLAGGVPTFKTVFSTLLREHARRCGKPRWGEQTPAHRCYVGQLLDWYPNARIIYMLRDPRAVVASLLDAPWTSAAPEFHAMHWRESIQALLRWECDERLYRVHYEALLIDPESVLRKVCAFLGEPFDPTVLTRCEASATTRVSHGKWSRGHLSDALGPLRTDCLAKWQLRLTPNQVAIVEYLTRKGMLRYGYELSSEGPGALLWSTLMLNRLWTRVKRQSDRLRGQTAHPIDPPPRVSDQARPTEVARQTDEDTSEARQRRLLGP
ncbi:MAG: sulfotransferase [Nitrococcus mobilis]|nr:sulfotransferase [Nitrococcus mobilis]